MEKINLFDSVDSNKNNKSISPLDISKRGIEDLKMRAIKAPNAAKAKIIAGKNTLTHTPWDSKDGRENQHSLKRRKRNNNLRAQGKGGGKGGKGMNEKGWKC